MNKYEEFIEYFCELNNGETLPPHIEEVLQELKAQAETLANKPLFTESGLQILEYLQQSGTSNIKAKDIADGMGVSSKKISGAMRKLVSDGYCTKMGQNPVVYNLTEQGKEFDITTYKKENNDNE